VRWRAAALLLALAAAGCATPNGEPSDPLEGLNRGVHAFNNGFDRVLARPVATAYRDWVHEEIRNRVRSFFSNLYDPMIGLHNMLQGKFEDGFLDWMRFAFNSTIGLFGLHDIATDMGYDKHNEDFGQTFGRWGIGAGPYLVLPFLGPSSARDGLGIGLDIYFDPISRIEGATQLRVMTLALRFTQQRADLLEATRLIEEAALDHYVFTRDAFFQRRRNLVYDGRPPREEAR